MKWLLLASGMTFQKVSTKYTNITVKGCQIFQMISDSIKIASIAIYYTPKNLEYLWQGLHLSSLFGFFLLFTFFFLF